jgi:hypothetical protein
LRHGQFALPDYPKTVFGIPPFLAAQLMRQSVRTLGKMLTGQSGLIRQAMIVSNTWGLILGYRKRSPAQPAK